MTVIYKLEITAQFEDTEEKVDKAERFILDPELKAGWQRKVEKAFSRFAPDCETVCTDIKVFPEI